MRRKDMIRKLEDKIADAEGAWPHDLAPLILDFLESEGMQPPLVPAGSKIVTEFEDGTMRVSFTLCDTNIWEPE